MKYFRLFILISFSFLLSSCASPPSKFYLMVPSGSQTNSKITKKSISVGLNSVVLPRYLKKPQIITWIGSNELHVSEFNRWAESLEYNIEQVIAENITNNNPKILVINYPWPSSSSIRYQIFISFLNFDTKNYGVSTLKAKWRITDKRGKRILYQRISFYKTPVTLNSYNNIVHAMNINLNKFSFAISHILKRIVKHHRHV